MSRFHRFRISVSFKAIALMLILGLFLTLMPVQAQVRPTSAITLDGHQLFKVSEAGQISAENRAVDANLILTEAVRSTARAKIEIVENNQLPVIRVNGRHLLTVTSQDTPTGRTKQEQAQIWAQHITDAISQVKKKES
jgi:hypothetical protein